MHADLLQLIILARQRSFIIRILDMQASGKRLAQPIVAVAGYVPVSLNKQANVRLIGGYCQRVDEICLQLAHGCSQKCFSTHL